MLKLVGDDEATSHGLVGTAIFRVGELHIGKVEAGDGRGVIGLDSGEFRSIERLAVFDESFLDYFVLFGELRIGNDKVDRLVGVSGEIE